MCNLYDLDDYILQHVFSYLKVMDLCEMLCVSKKFSISRIPLQKVVVTGFYVHDFCLWLRKHNILSISWLNIENYYIGNDHCMRGFGGCCDCIDAIIDTLSNINVTTLVLKNVNLDDRQIFWKGLQNLYVGDCRFDVDWINKQNLKRLIVNNYVDYYYPEPLLTEQIVLYGLKIPHLEYFESNGFIFEEQLTDFLDQSNNIETLKTFRIQSLIDSENDFTKIVKNVQMKFKNTKVDLY